jgi:isocitrate dehydrogenase kinase/phosphatase
MVLARLAFPGALETQLWQLTQWKEQKKLDFYETKPREVIVYLRSMAPKEKKQIYFDLVARVTGNYTGAASSAYLYYTNDKKDWTSPLRLSISP